MRSEWPLSGRRLHGRRISAGSSPAFSRSLHSIPFPGRPPSARAKEAGFRLRAPDRRSCEPTSSSTDRSAEHCVHCERMAGDGLTMAGHCLCRGLKLARDFHAALRRQSAPAAARCRLAAIAFRRRVFRGMPNTRSQCHEPAPHYGCREPGTSSMFIDRPASGSMKVPVGRRRP